MTNLYHRNLLTDFDVAEFIEILTDAKSAVRNNFTIPEQFRDAVVCRLDLRGALLTAVAFDLDVLEQVTNPHWLTCLNLLPYVAQSNKVGVPVDDSFTAKVQRRLASTVPPRPIVKISFQIAYEGLKRLCEDGKNAGQILECRSGSEITVSVLLHLLEWFS